MQATAPSLSQILRPREVAKRLGIHRTTLWRAVQRGEFPPPIHVTRGAIGWPEPMLVKLMAEREGAPVEPSEAR